MKYPGAQFVVIRHSPSEQERDLQEYFQFWKRTYLVPAGIAADGSGTELWRVAKGKPNSPEAAQTVSEGQGYGMMILALMPAGAIGSTTDRIIFDGLLKFAEEHPSQIDGRLMSGDFQVNENPDPDEVNSAFDGDSDIAYALLVADKRWGGQSGAIDYSSAARRRIEGIRTAAVGSESFLPLLGDWITTDRTGSSEDCKEGCPVQLPPPTFRYTQFTWRPSDFMPGHFRAFGRFTRAETYWETVIKTCQGVVDGFQSAATGRDLTLGKQTGLVPDFVCPPPPTDPQPLLLPVAAPRCFLESVNDGAFYFNAVRVPWRIGVDALINADAGSATHVRVINDWARSRTLGKPSSFSNGYHLNGDPIESKNGVARDLIAAPMGVAAMAVSGNTDQQEWVEALYDFIRRHDDEDNYYEDSIKLLCLLVMTGHYSDPTLP
jgi:hypothetical protein